MTYGQTYGKVLVPLTLGGALGLIHGWEYSNDENYPTCDVANALRAYIGATWNYEGYEAFLQRHPKNVGFIMALRLVLEEEVNSVLKRKERDRMQPRLF